MTGGDPGPDDGRDARAPVPRRRSFDGVAGLTGFPPGPHLAACAPAPVPAPGPVPASGPVPAPGPAVVEPVPTYVETPVREPGALSGLRRIVGLAPAPERLRHYEAGAALARHGLRADRPEAAAAVERTAAEDIVVVLGGFDRVQDVLDRLGLRYTTVMPDRMAGLDLRPEQVLIVNCPGIVGPRAQRQVRRFVRDGGTLLSTDWALRELVAPAFPGTIRHNGAVTPDTVVGVRPKGEPHPLLAGAFARGDDARWWLETGSYPILVLARWKVTVLLASTEMMLRWAASPVAVRFSHGHGEVFHMVSHFYLQRCDEGGPGRGSSAEAFAESRGGRFRAGLLAGITARQLQSATSSARLLLNVLAEKRVHVEEARGAPR